MRPSRPRPSVWCSASATAPCAASAGSIRWVVARLGGPVVLAAERAAEARQHDRRLEEHDSKVARATAAAAVESSSRSDGRSSTRGFPTRSSCDAPKTVTRSALRRAVRAARSAGRADRAARAARSRRCARRGAGVAREARPPDRAVPRPVGSSPPGCTGSSSTRARTSRRRAGRPSGAPSRSSRTAASRATATRPASSPRPRRAASSAAASPTCRPPRRPSSRSRMRSTCRSTRSRRRRDCRSGRRSATRTVARNSLRARLSA